MIFWDMQSAIYTSSNSATNCLLAIFQNFFHFGKKIKTFLKSGMKFGLIKSEENESIYETIFDAFINTIV